MSAANIELDIDELMLHGFNPGDRYRVGSAFERELTRLFMEQGYPRSPSRDMDISRLNGGSLNVAANSKPETIGVRVAQSVYGCITKTSNGGG